MKRQILCLKCGQDPLENYPCEWHRTIQGKAIRLYVCDLCGERIPAGSLCYAQSMGINQHPYFEWEETYIRIKAGTVAVLWQG